MKKKLSILLSGALLFGTLAMPIYGAVAKSVNLQAYYDTFKLNINGENKYISSTDKKPFIANSRIYVPLTTLNDYGIADVEWSPEFKQVIVKTKVKKMDDDKKDYYEQQINYMQSKAVTAENLKKELEKTNKTLLDENTNLKNEVKDLKEKLEKKNDRWSYDYSRDRYGRYDRDRRVRLSDVEYDLNRISRINSIRLADKEYEIKYRVKDADSREFNIYADIRNLDDNAYEYIKNNERIFRDLCDDVRYETSRYQGYEDAGVYLTLYDTTKDRTIGTFYSSRR